MLIAFALTHASPASAFFSVGPEKPPRDNSQPNADLAQPERAYAHKAATDEAIADKAANDETAPDATSTDETTADETGAVASFNTANALASDVTGCSKHRASSATMPAPFSYTNSLPPPPTHASQTRDLPMSPTRPRTRRCSPRRPSSTSASFPTRCSPSRLLCRAPSNNLRDAASRVHLHHPLVMPAKPPPPP
jgi:hypothetical protein